MFHRVNSAHEMKAGFLNGILDLVRDFYPDPDRLEVQRREIQVNRPDEFLAGSPAFLVAHNLRRDLQSSLSHGKAGELPRTNRSPKNFCILFIEGTSVITEI